MARFVKLTDLEDGKSFLLNTDHVMTVYIDSYGKAIVTMAQDLPDGEPWEFAIVESFDEIAAMLGIAPPKQPLMHEVHLERCPHGQDFEAWKTRVKNALASIK
jgi:hypothetical protein